MHEQAPIVIGSSVAGRPLTIRLIGAPDAPLRLLIVAGQHGDEPLASSAVATLAPPAAPLSGENGTYQCALLPCLNPDGLAQQQRTNAHAVDLNRDHQVLSAIETQALHRFVRHWQPHLIVDVHTYPPRRQHLLRQNLIYCHDLFLDVMSNPAIQHPLLAEAADRFLSPVTAQLQAEGYRCGRYTLIRPNGRARHSTPDVVDARNGLALRYSAFTVLIEGRTPPRNATPARQAQVVTAIQQAILATIQWARQNRPALLAARSQPDRPPSIAVGTKYAPAQGPLVMAFRERHSGQIGPVTVPGRFTPTLRPTRRVALPLAYAVPPSHHGVTAILARHGFTPQRFTTQSWAREGYPAPTHYALHAYRVAEPTSGSAKFSLEPYQGVLTDFWLFPTAQPGGHSLALFLEPTAKYGLTRYPESQLTCQPGTLYPILRVTEPAGQIGET